MVIYFDNELKLFDLLHSFFVADFGDVMHYATQDGTVIDEEFADKIYEKIEYIFDNLDDQIENELDENCDQSLSGHLYFCLFV